VIEKCVVSSMLVGPGGQSLPRNTTQSWALALRVWRRGHWGVRCYTLEMSNRSMQTGPVAWVAGVVGHDELWF